MKATTLEQSRELVELGIDPKTADMSFCNDGTASTQKSFPHQFVTEEYVRTDAFIEKAYKFLSKLSNYNEGFIYPSHSGVIDSFVNNFKNYMKGE